MFDNLFYQNASRVLSDDLKNGTLPSSLLFAGPENSGKLTCALELARILSCRGNSKGEKGSWQCECRSCRKNKELGGTNLILTGPRDCTPEIHAAGKTLLFAGLNNAPFLLAARYLFIRAVRKLTLRFNPVLWEGDDKLSKMSPLLEEINENLELLNPEVELFENEQLEKVVKKITDAAEKLEKSFLYDSLPTAQIRRVSFWAHMTSAEEKKIVIIENAYRMNENCRNALLKILEEPPADTVFILTTTQRGAVLPTILSRVRTYTFAERSVQQESEVIQNIFRENPEKFGGKIKKYLYSFLPVSPEKTAETAASYYKNIKNGSLISMADVSKQCGDFEPRTVFRLFLEELISSQAKICGFEMQAENLNAIKECYNSVFLFNQKPVSSLEKLYRDLSAINRKYAG